MAVHLFPAIVWVCKQNKVFLFVNGFVCSLSIMHMDPVCKGRSVGLNLLTVIELLHSLDYKVGGGGVV